jgi:hypothetical protein
MNAYEASKIASEPTRNRRRAKRTRADIRTIFGSFVAMLLGCLAWHAQSLMSGTPVYEPYGLLPLGLVCGAFLAFPSYLVGLCFYAVSMFCPVDSKFGPWAGFLPSRQD